MTTYETRTERPDPPNERIVRSRVEHCPTCGAEMPEGFRFCGRCGRALAAALAPAPGDIVTIVFTDLVGFTAFASEAEQDAVRELVLAYHALVRDQVSRHGGFEVKQTGDGFMVAFSSAQRALLCAVDVQRALDHQVEEHDADLLHVRIGLNSGDAIRHGHDFFGHTVNIASRIAGRARGGQVLASESTRTLAGHVDGVRFTDLGRRRLRGIPGRHRFYEAAWGE